MKVFVTLIGILLTGLIIIGVYNQFLKQYQRGYNEGYPKGYSVGYEKYQKEKWVPKSLYIKKYSEYPDKLRNLDLKEKFKG